MKCGLMLFEIMLGFEVCDVVFVVVVVSVGVIVFVLVDLVFVDLLDVVYVIFDVVGMVSLFGDC